MTKLKKMNKRPLFDNMITTANRKGSTASGILLTDNMDGKRQLLTTQTVLRVGDNVPKYIKEGTVVEFNMETFPRERVPAKHDIGPDGFIVMPPLYEDLEGYEFMIVSPRNLLYIIEDEVE